MNDNQEPKPLAPPHENAATPGATQDSLARIIAEMRIFKCRNLETGELELCNAIANCFADRLEAAARRAYNQIDSAVCGIEDAASCEIDYVRKAMENTIGDYYE